MNRTKVDPCCHPCGPTVAELVRVRNRKSYDFRYDKSDVSLTARPSGFTLLEMLLVLAVVVVALAVLYPATDRLYRTHRLSQSAQQLRTHLAATRLRSIDQGVIYEFRFEPRGRRLLLRPHGNQGAAIPINASIGQLDEYGDSTEGQLLFSELPPGIKFQSTDVAVQQISLDARHLPRGDRLLGVSWSRPLLFFPDGSSTDAEIDVSDQYGRSIRLSLRGLTGAATTLPIRQVTRR